MCLLCSKVLIMLRFQTQKSFGYIPAFSPQNQGACTIGQALSNEQIKKCAQLGPRRDIQPQSGYFEQI